MRRWAMMSGILTALIWAFPVHAAFIQYRTVDMTIAGAFETQADTRVTPGMVVLELPGVSLSAVPWPVPLGCVAGRAEWTRVATVGPPVVLAVRLNHQCFRGMLVQDLQQLHGLVNQFVDRMMAQATSVQAKVSLLVIEALSRYCPVPNPADLDCVAMRSDAQAVEGKLPNKAAMRVVLADVRTLLDEAAAFKTARGW